MKLKKVHRDILVQGYVLRADAREQTADNLGCLTAADKRALRQLARENLMRSTGPAWMLQFDGLVLGRALADDRMDR